MHRRHHARNQRGCPLAVRPQQCFDPVFGSSCFLPWRIIRGQSGELGFQGHNFHLILLSQGTARLLPAHIYADPFFVASTVS